MRKMLAVSILCAALAAEERIDSEANWKFRREAAEHSQIMRTLHVLTDRYGPRLTGSPNHEAAAKWAVCDCRGGTSKRCAHGSGPRKL